MLAVTVTGMNSSVKKGVGWFLLENQSQTVCENIRPLKSMFCVTCFYEAVREEISITSENDVV